MIKILEGAGSISNEMMEKKINELYVDFNARRKVYEAKMADNEDMAEIKEIESNVKNHFTNDNIKKKNSWVMKFI